MEALYHQTNYMVNEVQDALGRLEKATGNNVSLVENEIKTRIDQIISNCERLEVLVNKEPPTRRSNAKLRVDQLKYDCQHIQAALRNLCHRRYQQEAEDQEREALLTREFRANDDTTSIQIDAGLTHHQRLTESHNEMDNMIHSGSSILNNLRDQRGTLKNAHRKILDVANYLGLSNTVLRLIEKRAYQDKFILFGGMLVTCVIMYLVWSYLT